MSLRSIFQRRPLDLQVRVATPSDRPALQRLFYHGRRMHLLLEWWDWEEWLGWPTFLLALEGERPVAALLAVPEAGATAWIRAAATILSRDDKPVWSALLQRCQDALPPLGIARLAYLGDAPWLVPALRQQGFQWVNRVITLAWTGREPPSIPTASGTAIRIRPATRRDIPAVVGVDQAAFPPLWWYSETVLRRALLQAHHFLVAERGQKVVGYQFSTLRERHGHIVRLAIHPTHQRQGIGRRLLLEALHMLARAGATEVTVNTQEDNDASRRLYDRLAFHPLGHRVSVWMWQSGGMS
ncbi:MAG: N-acetyltransferase [Chloroflexi bacterium]|nr:MAG: N-acetyltransferase [Chloroflexota bacterium]